MHSPREKQTLHKVEHPILPINPLFHQDIEPQELKNEIKKLNSDKYPRDDGITNRMIQAGGPKFEEILHEVFDTLWQHDIQPKAWQMSLMQPIYKGGDKSRVERPGQTFRGYTYLPTNQIDRNP